MDNITLGAALGIIQGLPETDISRAEDAANRAEYAAEQIVGLNYDISVSGTKLSIVGRSGNNG